MKLGIHSIMLDVTMVDVQFTVERISELPYIEEREKKYHKERAKLVKQVLRSQDIEVIKNDEWKKMNGEEPHEYVEIITAMGSAGVFAAAVAAFKAYLDHRKLKSVEIRSRGQYIKLENATPEQIKKVIKALKFPK